jgi:hypothetical protein
MTESQRAELDETVTRWDSLLDTEMGHAERDTLTNAVRERDELAKERIGYKSSRASELQCFEQAKQSLKKRIEGAKEQASKTRDGLQGKIDKESHGLDQRMRAAREWVGEKTGNPVLIQWTSHATPARAQEIASIASLDGIAKEFEQAKKKVVDGLEDLQRQPSLRLISYPLLVLLGAASGGIASGIAYAMQWPPLIWGAVGISAAIVVPALTSLGTSPWVTRKLKALFPPVVDLEKEAQLVLQQGRKLIDRNFQNELAKLDAEWKSELQALEKSHSERLEQIDSRHQKKKKLIADTALRSRMEIAKTRTEKMASIQREESSRVAAVKQSHAQAKESITTLHAQDVSALRQAFERSQQYIVGRWARGVEQFARRIAQQRKSLDDAFPEWDSMALTNGAWPRSLFRLAWPIGCQRIESRFECDDSVKSLKQCVGEIEPVPILFDLVHHGNLLVDADADNRHTARGLIRQLVLRAITSLPAGAIHTTVIDPEGLGKEFSWMMHLADVDPQLVNHRVWTQPVHIAHQLELAARHVEDVIQQSLRNRFRNLADYNSQAGPMTIPYRLIIWSGFPLGLDEYSWQSLCSLLASGGRCGVGLILHLAENCKWPPFADPAKLREHGLAVVLRGGPTQASVSVSGRDATSFEWIDPPSDLQVATIMEYQLAAAKNIGKRIVPFSSIAPSGSARHQAASHDGLEIPIGISESGRVQSLSLGSGTSQHVLIAGKTGSGKSSLLHTMITSGALRYSPDQLRMVLLDFKKGVEFQIYAERQLPHADVIGIESRREFGLSVLEYLDRILSARGEAFRVWGVQDLPSLHRKHPEVSLPRILIVIDEFQEMFVEDDKLSQQASLLMDRLVRQGRSFGMHLVLASQTLGGSYSLPRTTLAQMAVRIALQCDSSDAMLILSEDNNAAERLRHSGQGIYNDAGGRIEGNHNFQVSFIQKQEQMELLADLPPIDRIAEVTINPIGKQIVFEGHKPSRWDQGIAQAVIEGLPESDRLHAPWILGESVSIEPPIVRTFPSTAGRNAMIVGNDSGIVAGLLASWIRTAQAAEQTKREVPLFTLLDGSNTEDLAMAKATEWARQQTDCVQIATVRELDRVTTEIREDWERRSASPDTKHPTRILFISNIARFREFRRSDEFSFSSDEAELKPDALLGKLISEGPALGIHVCIWADTATTLQRWLPRNVLRDIEMRILMQMSAADSNQLIDSSLANRLDRYVLLVHDDADGKSVKFRPCEWQSIVGKS